MQLLKNVQYFDYLVFCPRTLSHAQVFSSPLSSPCTPCFWPGLQWPMSLVRMLPNIMLSSQRCHSCMSIDCMLTCLLPCRSYFSLRITSFSISTHKLSCRLIEQYALLFSHLSDRACNPSLLSIFQQITAPTLAPLEMKNQTAVMITGTEEPVLTSPYLQWWDAQSIVGLTIFVLCILYSR